MNILIDNKTLYESTKALNTEFGENYSKYLPVRVNFIIQSNLTTLLEKSRAIEKVRDSIGAKYGEFVAESNVFQICPENRKQAQKELDDLMEIEQKVDIKMIKLSDLESLEMTTSQMRALLFMIEEE